MSKLQDPIIIAGAQRSGTTLLRTMLNEHPKLLVHPAEPQFILELFQHFGHVIPDGALARDQILQHPYRAPNVTAGTLGVLSSPTHISVVVANYLQVWMGEASRRKRPVLKHPALIFHLDLIDELFSNATVIHVVRDPRANVSSQRTRWPQFSVWTCAMLWRRAVNAARRWASDFPTRYLEVQYESLVQQPETALQEVCAALSLPFSPRLLAFEQWETIYEPEGKPREKRFTHPDPAHIDLWRERLTAEDIQLIEQCCRKEMTWWDYPLLYPDAGGNQLLIRRLKESTLYRWYRLGKFVKFHLRRLRWQLVARLKHESR